MTTKPEKSLAQNPASLRTAKQVAADLARHARKCAVCRHPDRGDIEEDFLLWEDPHEIKCAYKLPSRSCLYRHARATGLLERRRRNLRAVAEHIMENLDTSSISAGAVLRAMRICAHITNDGQWIEPPKRVIVTHIHTYAPPLSSAPAHSEPALAASAGASLLTPPTAPNFPQTDPLTDLCAPMPPEFLIGTNRDSQFQSRNHK